MSEWVGGEWSLHDLTTVCCYHSQHVSYNLEVQCMSAVLGSSYWILIPDGGL